MDEDTTYWEEKTRRKIRFGWGEIPSSVLNMLRLEVFIVIFIYTPKSCLKLVNKQILLMCCLIFFSISVLYFLSFFSHHNLDSHHLTSGKLNNLLSSASPNTYSVQGCSINLLKTWFCCVILYLTAFRCFPIANIILPKLLTDRLLTTPTLSRSSLRVWPAWSN